MASIQKRLRRDGGVSWGVRVKVKGYGLLSKTFPTKFEAERWAWRTEAAARGRTLALANEATLSELIDEFTPKAKPETVRLLKYWRVHLGDLRIRDVSPVLIAKHRDLLLGAPTRSFGQHRLKPRSSATVRHYLGALSAAFRFGVRELHWLESNPVANVTKPAPSQWRKRFLTDEERTCLLAECKSHPHLYAAVLLSVTTGLRRGELYRLAWTDIDAQRRWAVLGQTKNGDSRGIALTLRAIEALADLPKDTERVFPFDMTKSWRAAMRRAGLTDFRWHDLRHSAASHLAKSGANVIEIAQLLGHRTLGMVRRYAHLANSHTSSLVDRVMGDVS